MPKVADPCATCEHEWHGLTCRVKWFTRPNGSTGTSPDECGCAGPFPVRGDGIEPPTCPV